MEHKRIDSLCLPNTKYIVYRSKSGYKVGTIVMLDYDDLSDCPSYENVVTGNTHYMYCDDLKPYVPKNIVGGHILTDIPQASKVRHYDT